MHTPSTRILSALAYDCGIEDFDPTDPVCLELVDALSLAEHAASGRRRARTVRARADAGAGAPAAQAGAGVVLGRGPDRRAVGDRASSGSPDRSRGGLGARPRCRGARPRSSTAHRRGLDRFTTTTSEEVNMVTDYFDRYPGRRGARRHARVPRIQPGR